VGFDDLAEGFAGVAPSLEDGLGLGSVDDFPSLADGGLAGEGAGEGGLEAATAPDAFLVKRLKSKEFVHTRRDFGIFAKSAAGVIAFDREAGWVEV
jgi:hypothetical protein